VCVCVVCVIILTQFLFSPLSVIWAGDLSDGKSNFEKNFLTEKGENTTEKLGQPTGKSQKKKAFLFLGRHTVCFDIIVCQYTLYRNRSGAQPGSFLFSLPVSNLSSLFSSRKICLCLFYSWESLFFAWVGMMSSTSDIFQSNHFWNGCDRRVMFKNVKRRCRDTESMSSGVIYSSLFVTVTVNDSSSIYGLAF